jgi:hypothetical protein
MGSSQLFVGRLLPVVRDQIGNPLTTFSSFFVGTEHECVNGAVNAYCFVPGLPILEGNYGIELWSSMNGVTEDWLLDATGLRVEHGNYFGIKTDTRLPKARYHGSIVVAQRWSNCVPEIWH